MAYTHRPIDKWFKSPPFHGGVTGSNPVGTTFHYPPESSLLLGIWKGFLRFNSIHKKKALNVADGKLRHTPLFCKVCEDVNR